MPFQPSRHLLQNLRITLFIRQNCSLCTDAKDTLSKVWDSRPFKFVEIDVMRAERKAWADLYQFDTPVIHVSKADAPEERPEFSGKAAKLMHRFKPEEVHAKMDSVEKDDKST